VKNSSAGRKTIINQSINQSINDLSFYLGHSRDEVVRAEAQRSDDPCVPGSNPTVGPVAVGVARTRTITANMIEC
jgi:hypothetical protein